MNEYANIKIMMIFVLLKQGKEKVNKKSAHHCFWLNIILMCRNKIKTIFVLLA